VRKSTEDKPSLSVNHEWFDTFKRKAILHNLKITGEVASADKVAASIYPIQ
jgi:hypothetical protein